jgi:hypothetical protein
MTFLLDVANAAVRYDGANNDMVFKREKTGVMCYESAGIGLDYRQTRPSA